jgi:hypothetical protein
MGSLTPFLRALADAGFDQLTASTLVSPSGRPIDVTVEASRLIAGTNASMVELAHHWAAIDQIDPVFADGWFEPVAWPVDHPWFPGSRWTVQKVMGNVLTFGWGVRLTDSDALPAPVPTWWWPSGSVTRRGWGPARARLERDAEDAALSWAAAAGRHIRPFRRRDVLTLLGTRAFRDAVVSGQAGRVAAAAAPSRGEAWVMTRMGESEFAVAAAGVEDGARLGLLVPVLVSRDEVRIPARPSGSVVDARDRTGVPRR